MCDCDNKRLRMVIVDDRRNLQQLLKSSKGQEVMIETLQRNPKQLREILKRERNQPE